MNKKEEYQKSNLRLKKEQQVIKLIQRISNDYINSGLEKRHVDKALKYYLNINAVTDDSIDLNQFQEVLLEIEKQLHQLALNTENNFIRQLTSFNKPKEEKNIKSDKIIKDKTKNSKQTIKEPETQINSLIEKIASEYQNRGIEKKHIEKAKKYYLEYYQSQNIKTYQELEIFLKYIENELYILAEQTKNNYIQILKQQVLNNENIKKEDKKEIIQKIYPTKQEKEKTVTALIDRIAKEYSNDGVFERHIQKAYNIFLNRPEVTNNMISLEDFQKFIENIEQELYVLAEQTKKNYEFFRKESEKHGKVLRKGEDIR